MTVKELKRMLQYVSDDTNIMISEFDEYGDVVTDTRREIRNGAVDLHTNTYLIG